MPSPISYCLPSFCLHQSLTAFLMPSPISYYLPDAFTNLLQPPWCLHKSLTAFLMPPPIFYCLPDASIDLLQPPWCPYQSLIAFLMPSPLSYCLPDVFTTLLIWCLRQSLTALLIPFAPFHLTSFTLHSFHLTSFHSFQLIFIVQNVRFIILSLPCLTFTSLLSPPLPAPMTPIPQSTCFNHIPHLNCLKHLNPDPHNWQKFIVSPHFLIGH